MAQKLKSSKAIQAKMPNLIGKKLPADEKRTLTKEEQYDLDIKLIGASSRGNDSEIRALIREGADVWARDESDWNPLTCAAAGMHFRACELLLRHVEDSGRNVGEYIESTVDASGWTALLRAAGNGSTRICRLLLRTLERSGKDVGKYINTRNHDGHTALSLASVRAYQKTSVFLAKYALKAMMGKKDYKLFISAFEECAK